jgi:hypothetical protein
MFQKNILVGGALTGSKKFILNYQKLETGVAMAAARLKCSENYVVVGDAVHDAHVVYGELFWASGYTGDGVDNEGFGGAFTVDTTGAASAPSGLLYGLKARIKGTLETGSFKHCAAMFQAESAVYTVVRFLNQGAITNMLDFNIAASCTNLINIGGATNITNLIKFNAAAGCLAARAADVSGDNTSHSLAIDIGGVTHYLAVWSSLWS